MDCSFTVMAPHNLQKDNSSVFSGVFKAHCVYTILVLSLLNALFSSRMEKCKPVVNNFIAVFNMKFKLCF